MYLKTYYPLEFIVAVLNNYGGFYQRTKNNKKMWFGTFLNNQENFLDTTHFPGSTPAYPFHGKGCYLISGKVVEDFGFPSLEVIRFTKLPIKDNPVF